MLRQEYKTFGFCTGEHLIAIAAESLADAQYLAFAVHGVDDGVPLTQVTLDEKWDIAVTSNISETKH